MARIARRNVCIVELYPLLSDMAICECVEFLRDSLCGFAVVES